MFLLQDLKYALRALLKSPAFTAAAGLVLALGIGANTAMFSVVDGLLLRPLPFPQPDSLVQLWHVPPAQSFHGMPKFSLSPANYLDWKAQNHVFEATAAYDFSHLNLTGAGEPEGVIAARVESSFFHVLGIQPQLGRAFTPDEEKVGNGRAVILSDGLWRSRFGADRSIVGRTVQFDSQPYTIVGVMPPSFQFPTEAPVKMWVPLAWTDKDRATRGIHDYEGIARLKPGVSVANAQAEMNTISANLEKQFPEDDKSWGALVEPLRESRVGEARPALLMMLGAVAFVLLIACANVANLVFARTLSRQKEIAIRTALGATRARILLQTLMETVLLAVMGGIIGLGIAHFAIGLIVSFLGEDVARVAQIQLDSRVLLVTLLISIFTGIAAGLLPAIRFTRANLNEVLKQGHSRPEADRGTGSTRNVLVVIEMALSLMLLVGAGLTVRSLWNLQRVDTGLDSHNVLTLEGDLPDARYSGKQQQIQFFDTALAKMRALPGVESAGVIDSLPVVSGGSSQPIVIEGQPAGPMAEQPEVAVRKISPAYLGTLRIPIVEGRDFIDSDAGESKPVIIITKSMAKRFWPGQSAIGKRLTLSFAPEKIREVVGVAGDVKMRGLESDAVIPTLYQPMRQSGLQHFSFVLRTSTSPTSLAAPATAAIRQIDSQLSLQGVDSMDALLLDSLSQRRLNMMLLAGFAGLAVFLAAVGIYSVLSYSVRRRVREIGIRLALGAQHADVLRLIVFEGMKPMAVGVIIGVIGSLALHRVLQSIVFGLSAADPVNLVVVTASLVTIGLAASAIPAYRATKVEPVKTLRDE